MKPDERKEYQQIEQNISEKQKHLSFDLSHSNKVMGELQQLHPNPNYEISWRKLKDMHLELELFMMKALTSHGMLLTDKKRFDMGGL